MKKFLLAAMIFGVVVQIVVPSQAQAEDHYLGNWEGGWKAYLVIESLDFDFVDIYKFIGYCSIKAVSPKNTVKVIDYVFESINDNNGELIGASFRDSTGASGRFYAGQPGEYEIEYLAFGAIRLFIVKCLEEAGNSLHR